METNNWAVGDLVCMYFGSTERIRLGTAPTVGLITAAGEKEDHWKVMYESEWGIRTVELPQLIFYRTEQEGEKNNK